MSKVDKLKIQVLDLIDANEDTTVLDELIQAVREEERDKYAEYCRNVCENDVNTDCEKCPANNTKYCPEVKEI